jgi:lysyl-tRNA synthetase class 1
MLPTLGEERRATYSPFLPISPKTGRVLQVPTLERNVEAGTIVWRDPRGRRSFVTPVTGGHVKLQWKPDWAMRWTALGVDYEMSGKDLIDSSRSRPRSARRWAACRPKGFNYELFLDEKGQKISKSKGNGLTMEDWLRYGTPESLAYYMFQSPRSRPRSSISTSSPRRPTSISSSSTPTRSRSRPSSSTTPSGTSIRAGRRSTARRCRSACC